MLLIDKKEFTLRSSGRLVKAEEVAAARSAAETVAAAEAEAARIPSPTWRASRGGWPTS